MALYIPWATEKTAQWLYLLRWPMRLQFFPLSGVLPHERVVLVTRASSLLSAIIPH
jgi:hypothetical protein